MIKRTVSSILLTASLVGFTNAQQSEGITCGTHDLSHLAPLHQYDPARLAEMEQAEQDLEAFTQAYLATAEDERGGSQYVIPVVFHIIHNNGPENISDAQVHDAMRVLNEDFNRLNNDWQNVRPDFLGLVADVGIEFRLAQKDPQGNCTKGITRTQSVLTYDGDQAMKNLIQWPRNRYLNVWVAASAAGAAGYTQIPSTVNSSWAAAADGIVLLHSYTGSIGTSSQQRSRTLTHEVGHWINLRHTWGPTNNPGVASNCNEDDNVTDTPNTIGWTTCNTSGQSCGSLDNVENYMEYSYCSKMFTTGQRSRMLAALNSSTAQRNQLWQPSNLTFTGVNGQANICAAEFVSDRREVCVGGTIQFQDVSYHGVTQRTWSFPGGSPATSTAEDPVVTYDTPGVYPVTLTAGDGNQNVSTTVNDHVIVLGAPGINVPYGEDFENIGSFPGTGWRVIDGSGNGSFALTNTTGFSGTHSLMINNHASVPGELDELLSTTMDMSGVSNISISFRYAYARRQTGDNDVLRFFVSSDCGQNWSIRRQLYGNNLLSTAPDQTAPFVPNGPGQWAQTTVDNISASYHVPNFRFRFTFENAGGNNVYLDDINVNGFPLSVWEESITTGQLAVAPNPADDQVRILFVPQAGEPLRVDLLDVTGRVVREVFQGGLPASPQQLTVDLAEYHAGVYFVRLAQGGRHEVVRLVVR